MFVLYAVESFYGKGQKLASETNHSAELGNLDIWVVLVYIDFSTNQL